MIHTPKVLLLSSDSYLLISVKNITEKYHDKHIALDVFPSNIMKCISKQPYIVIIVDERFCNLDKLVSLINRGIVNKLQRVVLFSFSEEKHSISKSLLYDNLNISDQLDEITKSMHNIFDEVLNEFSARQRCRETCMKELSIRESETLKLLIAGNSHYDVASQFSINIKTVYTYKYKALQKLGFSNVREYLFFKKTIVHAIL